MAEEIFYRFIRLELAQFATFDADCVDDGTPIELSSSFRFSYSFDDDLVCCATSVVIAKGTIPVLKAELNSYFKIQSESVELMTEDDCVVLPTGLMAQFASLGYGSMRGVIYAKTMGTPMDKIVLPPNDVRNIFTAPVRIPRMSVPGDRR